MALSLGFHIIFSCIGMVMPFFMAVSHYYWLKTNNIVYKNITKAWSKGVAIFFATGAVSGTVLSFELGLLWPTFMLHAGPIFGMPFSLEGTAFFIEAIALGFFLYGWNKFNPWFHWVTGVVVGVSGLVSGILVVAANGWMNSPSGFDYVDGKYINIDPVKAMFNDAWFSQALHMSIAAFVATGFAVAGVHAFMILKGKNVLFHAKAFKIAAVFGCIAAVLQPLSGDISAKDVAERQPAKLAAMEAHFHTGKSVPLIVGGVPDVKGKKVDKNTGTFKLYGGGGLRRGSKRLRQHSSGGSPAYSDHSLRISDHGRNRNAVAANCCFIFHSPLEEKIMAGEKMAPYTFCSRHSPWLYSC